MDNLLTLFCRVVDAVSSHPQGRPRKPKRGHPFTHPTAVIVKLLGVSVIKGWSLGETACNLRKRQYAPLRQMMGLRLKDIPTKGCLSKRGRHRDTEVFLGRTLRYLRKHLVVNPISDLRMVVIDLTDLPVEQRYDPKAKWGHVRKEEAFYGYKLHLLINRKGGLLQAFITTANKTETFRSVSMLAGLKRLFSLPISDGCVRHAIADSGYDAEDNYKMVEDLLLGVLVCKENPRNKKGDTPPGGEYRSKALRFSGTKRGRRLYKRHTIVEQVIGQLKDLFHLEDIPYWVKGLKAVRLWVLWRILVYTVAQYDNLLQRRPLRHVKVLIH